MPGLSVLLGRSALTINNHKIESMTVSTRREFSPVDQARQRKEPKIGTNQVIEFKCDEKTETSSDLAPIHSKTLVMDIVRTLIQAQDILREPRSTVTQQKMAVMSEFVNVVDRALAVTECAPAGASVTPTEPQTSTDPPDVGTKRRRATRRERNLCSCVERPDFFTTLSMLLPEYKEPSEGPYLKYTIEAKDFVKNVPKITYYVRLRNAAMTPLFPPKRTTPQLSFSSARRRRAFERASPNLDSSTGSSYHSCKTH